ncbi:MAG: hypothetical protein K6D02_02455 [Lachnospiraceae bacterium]|nr:hypothetical protein [Lachnospiraceae bacterium]
MKERILNYYNHIDGILKSGEYEYGWENLLEEHKTQIAYFQHERLIHLIVTVLFALATFMALIGLACSSNLWFAAILVPLIVLLIPYIGHYYLLENTTQKMYDQYDEILKKIREEK